MCVMNLIECLGKKKNPCGLIHLRRDIILALGVFLFYFLGFLVD